ncbi:MAG: hypothetical protein RBG13Loki_2729 [Promethearchaeota archaeon CR_4]|nr:MAG: hypothetical protein RBG13Loki_2729 [Candidatus Lokiarchaeota archaeon CR_4]
MLARTNSPLTFSSKRKELFLEAIKLELNNISQIFQFELENHQISSSNGSIKTTTNQQRQNLIRKRIVKMNPKQIQEISNLISTKQLKRDEYVWFLAEWELMLRPTYILPRSQNTLIYLPETIEFYPKRISRIPRMEDARYLAHMIDKKDFTIKDVLYCLAQRQIIADSLSDLDI